MSALITSTRRFDQEWNALISRSGIGHTYDNLLALKETMRDYLAVTLPESPFVFEMADKIYELSFIHATYEGQPRIELTSIKLAGSTPTQPIFSI